VTAAELVVCPLCRNRRAAFFAWKNGYALSRCGDCGFLFLDPMPTPDELASLYRDETSITPQFYPKANSRFRHALIKAIKLIRYIRNKDVIDVGCGGGFMAEAMHRLGGRAVGIDISSHAIAYARNRFPGVEFACEVLENFQNKGRIFDFVYCSEVIEHVPDAESFAAALAQICRVGGHLFVTTPDIGHWRVPKDLVSWPLVDPPRHVRYFNTTNLRMLLERHGFVLRHKVFKLKPGLNVLAQRCI